MQPSLNLDLITKSGTKKLELKNLEHRNSIKQVRG